MPKSAVRAAARSSCREVELPRVRAAAISSCRDFELSPFLVAVAVDKNDSGIDDEDNNKGDDNNSTNITNADKHG